LRIYGLSRLSAVIALHNNSEANYAATNYMKGQELAKEAAEVRMVRDQDPDDFFFVTEKWIFDGLCETKFNVVLQDNRRMTDDGSLSVYCGQHRISYVNVEAQHGHVNQQVEMLRAVCRILDRGPAGRTDAAVDSGAKLTKVAQLVDLQVVDPTLVIEARYATTNNITGVRLYPDSRLFLEQSAAACLSRVQKALRERGLGLKVFDAYRPLSVQRRLWQVKPDPNYVADPAKGSRHNRGCAVDVTLVDRDGQELAMPTAFDEFSEKARRDYQDLPPDVLRNRQILEEAMTTEGFEPLPTEWWHFDAPGWQHYEVIDANPYGKALFPEDGEGEQRSK
jgi:D-alanyl-D-alanine dipeptidase